MENKIDIGDIAGTGPHGRVLKDDIVQYVRSIDVRPSAVTMPRPAVVRGEDQRVPLRGYMRAMLKSMTEASSIPHFCYCDEVQADRLVDLRKQLKHIAKEKNIKMSYMPLFIKAASLALHHYPSLNASLDESLQNLTYKAAHNICIAMDTPEGLVVPNIKHCEELSMWEIAKELARLQEAAKAGKLSQSDLSDGTFSLSNIGTVGGTYTSPVIFVPQVAIGALGSIRVMPRYDESGAIRPTHIVNVSWAADHRVIDGATMARYSNLWKKYLENPALMIAEMK